MFYVKDSMYILKYNKIYLCLFLLSKGIYYKAWQVCLQHGIYEHIIYRVNQLHAKCKYFQMMLKILEDVTLLISYFPNFKFVLAPKKFTPEIRLNTTIGLSINMQSWESS